jgi:hypothetical protein
MKAGRIANKPKLRCVLFKLQWAFVHHVSLAGTFNGWDPTATPMCPAGHGRWARMLFLSPGRYDYALVVDGQVVRNPATNGSAEADEGGMTSVLVV